MVNAAPRQIDMLKASWFTPAPVTLSAHYQHGRSLRRRPRPQQGPRRLHRQGRQHQLHDGLAAPRQQVRALPRVSPISVPSPVFSGSASVRDLRRRRAPWRRGSRRSSSQRSLIPAGARNVLLSGSRDAEARVLIRAARVPTPLPDREIIREMALEGFYHHPSRSPTPSAPKHDPASWISPCSDPWSSIRRAYICADAGVRHVVDARAPRWRRRLDSDFGRHLSASQRGFFKPRRVRITLCARALLDCSLPTLR